MHSIQVSYIFHRNEKRIRLQFNDYEPLNKLVKIIDGAKWSRTLKSWHIPCSKSIYNNFTKELPEGYQLKEIKAIVDPVRVGNEITHSSFVLNKGQIIPQKLKDREGKIYPLRATFPSFYGFCLTASTKVSWELRLKKFLTLHSWDF